MKSIITPALAAVFALVPSALFAQTGLFPLPVSSRRVVVSATRTEIPIEQVASAVTVVDGQEIEARQLQTVNDVLRGVPGIDLVQNGPFGGASAVFIRGANSEHTLVLIDGVEANNPISPTRAFNFADLSAANIDRIEILRGPQSTLYGSDALGGVINIITKQGAKDPQAYASAEAGSYNTYSEQAGISGATDTVDYSLGLHQQNSHGISAITGGEEKDGYKNTAFSGRVGVAPSEHFRLNLISRYNQSDAELDNSAGDDDVNRVLDNEQFFARLEGETNFLSGSLTQKFGVGFNNQEFRDDNDFDIAHPLDDLRSRYTGRLLKFDLQNNFTVAPGLTLVVGAETEQERGSSDFASNSAFGPFESNFQERTARTSGYFTQVQVALEDRFFTTAGIRIDDHSAFGSEVSWRIAPSYIIRSTGTKFSSTYGTGFKAPSLFQLYSSFGNEDLDPERSKGFDAGVEQSFLDNSLAAGITYFWNDFDDLISFNPNTFISENIANARAEGIEASLSYQAAEDLLLRTSYTFTDTEDKDTGEALLRRPRSKASVKVDYQFSPRGNLNVTVNIVGRRDDNNFNAFPVERITMSGYAFANIAASYEIVENVQLFARVENLFDKEYEEVLGFGTRGAAAYAGIKVTL